MRVSKFNVRKKYFSWLVGTGVAFVTSLLVITACTDSAKAKLFVFKSPPPKPDIVAKIHGEEITLEKLVEGDKKGYYDLKTREAEWLESRRDQLQLQMYLEAEAKKANMSVDDFVAKRVVKGEIKVSDKDFKQFVTDRHIPESQINPQIKERIMTYLQTAKKQEMVHNYLVKLLKSSPLGPDEWYLPQPKFMVDIAPGNSPSFGKADAKVNVIEFSDFQCPFCSRAADTLNQLKKKYGSKVKFTFKQFPLPIHKDARLAAEASMCVNDQGSDKFWKFHDLAFKNQDKLEKANLEKWAKDVGADSKKFTECLDSKKFTSIVQGELDEGSKAGISSTPTFFINGRLLEGAQPIEKFAVIIDEELEKK
jgi:predicted DsbA family dithiol-disulfide isomerase